MWVAGRFTQRMCASSACQNCNAPAERIRTKRENEKLFGNTVILVFMGDFTSATMVFRHNRKHKYNKRIDRIWPGDVVVLSGPARWEYTYSVHVQLENEDSEDSDNDSDESSQDVHECLQLLTYLTMKSTDEGKTSYAWPPDYTSTRRKRGGSILDYTLHKKEVIDLVNESQHQREEDQHQRKKVKRK